MIDELKMLKEIQLIVFAMGKEEYALPIKAVQEIIMPQTPTKIPRLPSFIQGIINLRSKIIPIIDGKNKFTINSESTGSDNEKRIIILDALDHVIGLTVDSVSEVMMLNTSEIEEPPLAAEDDSEVVWGVGKFKNRLIILLNPEKFLDSSESVGLMKIQAIQETVKAA